MHKPLEAGKTIGGKLGNRQHEFKETDMGSKYTVEAWGNHHGDGNFMAVVWQGQSLITALYATWKARRAGYGCVTLSVRG